MRLTVRGTLLWGQSANLRPRQARPVIGYSPQSLLFRKMYNRGTIHSPARSHTDSRHQRAVRQAHAPVSRDEPRRPAVREPYSCQLREGQGRAGLFVWRNFGAAKFACHRIFFLGYRHNLLASAFRAFSLSPDHRNHCHEVWIHESSLRAENSKSFLRSPFSL